MNFRYVRFLETEIVGALKTVCDLVELVFIFDRFWILATVFRAVLIFILIRDRLCLRPALALLARASDLLVGRQTLGFAVNPPSIQDIAAASIRNNAG